MLFSVPASPKQQARFNKERDDIAAAEVPKTLLEFGRQIKIRSGKKFVPFELFEYQRKLDAAFDRPDVNFCVISKTRQTGLSEYGLLKMLHWAAQEAGFVGLVFSRTANDSFALAKRARAMVESHPSLELATDSLAELKLCGGGKILFRSPGNQNAEKGAGSGGRGAESVSAVFVDEAAFQRDLEQLLSSALPSTEMLGDDYKVLIVSTPNTKLDHYYNILADCPEAPILHISEEIREGIREPYYEHVDEHGFARIVIHWRAHPIYGEKTELVNVDGNTVPRYLADLRNRKKLPWSTIQREYNLSFDDSDNLLFSEAQILKGAISDFENNADDECLYYGGLDCNYMGRDYFSFSVLKYDGERLSLVHLYRKRKRGMEAHLEAIRQLIRQYDITTVGVETNSGGELYFQSLVRRNPSIEFTRINTTQESKILDIERISYLIESGQFTFPPCHFSDELSALQRDGKRIEASPGHHDDSVFSTLFAIRVSPLAADNEKPFAGVL